MNNFLFVLLLLHLNVLNKNLSIQNNEGIVKTFNVLKIFLHESLILIFLHFTLMLVMKCNTVEWDPENNQVTPQSPCGLIVKSSETMVVRIGKERGKETICQCASGVYHSERRPGLDPRFELGVKPVVFPFLPQTMQLSRCFL